MHEKKKCILYVVLIKLNLGQNSVPNLWSFHEKPHFAYHAPS